MVLYMKNLIEIIIIIKLIKFLKFLIIICVEHLLLFIISKNLSEKCKCLKFKMSLLKILHIIKES